MKYDRKGLRDILRQGIPNLELDFEFGLELDFELEFELDCELIFFGFF